MMHERKTAEETISDRRVEEIQFRLFYWATFVALLASGYIARLLPWRISDKSRRDDDRSVVQRAKEHAALFSAFAMG
ncbi:MAG: hypothetical protein AB7S93_17890 [Xanthobacteraceae bacterium]